MNTATNLRRSSPKLKHPFHKSASVAAKMVTGLSVVLIFRQQLLYIVDDIPSPALVESPLEKSDQIYVDYHQVWKSGYYDENSPQSSPPPEHSWILRDDSKSGTDVTSHHIPKIINKVFLQKRGGFPDSYNISQEIQDDPLQKAHYSWLAKNQGYQIRYYDLQKSRQYLGQYFNPVFLRAFDCIEAFASKSDLFRLALLYREGGWHSDWKQLCLRDKLLDTLADGVTMVATWDAIDLNTVQCIQNSFLGATPRHPLVAETLNRILKNVKNEHYGTWAIETTGPCVLGAAYAHLQKKNPASITTIRFGQFKWKDEGAFQKFQFNNQNVVMHKCKGCGSNQEWPQGNDYNLLHKKKRYYCQDAPSLFTSI